METTKRLFTDEFVGCNFYSAKHVSEEIVDLRASIAHNVYEGKEVM